MSVLRTAMAHHRTFGKKMTFTAKRCGFIGSTVLCALMIALGLFGKIPPFDSVTRHTSAAVLEAWVYPVIQLWEWLLPKIGFGGERALLMVFPIIFSCLIYAASIGFVLGWLAFRFAAKAK